MIINNFGKSVLLENINSSQTSFNVQINKNFNETKTTIRINSEKMYVTAINNNTITVVRGYDNTSVQSHSIFSTIKTILSAESYKNVIDENYNINNYELKQNEKIAINDDGFLAINSEDWYEMNGLYRSNKIETDGFTWLNQNGSTITNIVNGLEFGELYFFSRSDNVNFGTISTYKKDLITSVYTYTVGINPQLFAIDAHVHVGISLLDSSNKITFFSILQNNSEQYRLSCDRYNNFSSYNGNLFSHYASLSEYNYLRIKNDGSTRKFYFSTNGYYFSEIYSEAHNTFGVDSSYGYSLSRGNINTNLNNIGMQIFYSKIN